MMMQTSGATFLARLMKPSTMQTVRTMSTASGIQARFEQAYTERAAGLAGKAGAKQ